MHLPKIKFKKNVTFEKDIFLRIAKSIKTNQLDSGAIPSNADLSHDPWDHIEAIMGLNFLRDKESSDLALKWLKNNQNKDGSWYAKYSNNDPIELNKPTHFGPYISVAALHYFKIFSDKDKLFELWETIKSAIDFSIDLQNSNGTIPWSVDKNNEIENDFLLTGSSSILKSLECAIAISKILDLDSNEKWTKAYESLAYAVRNPEGLFDKKTDRSRFSMDSYYPIISGVLLDYEKEKYIKKIFKDFYVEGMGVKCVVDEPWVTVAETSEFIISLVISNELEEAKKILVEVMNISDSNDIPYMGWQYVENIFWPEEKPSWTAAALILAADSIFDFSPGSDILKDNQLSFF
ncbi:MAG: hypothetical protein CMD75_00650 [Gammaproteobacteria bacterium]|nr:hypothetical protein [Gammaproteobacteria bacterium]